MSVGTAGDDVLHEEIEVVTDGRQAVLNIFAVDARWTGALVDTLKPTAQRVLELVQAQFDEPLGMSTLRLTDGEEVKTLNQGFRGQDKDTNVLSFPAEDPAQSRAGAGEGGYLGDMAMSFDTCAREAQQDQKQLVDHFAHLLIHSLLHLLGYDHIDDTEAEEMEQFEIELLAALGIQNPYSPIQE